MTQNSQQFVQVSRSAHVATVTISRESALNALSLQVIDELTQVISELENDHDIRAAILTGAGSKAFVAGADIAEMKEMLVKAAQAFAEKGGRLAASLETSRLPWICAVNGFALGGGCELALACDFIVASRSAKFGQPEVKLGVVPGFGGTQRLLRRVGVAKAKQLCMSGETISAEEGSRIGLVDELTAPEELMTRANALASSIAQNGPLAVSEVKCLIAQGQSMSLDAALVLEQRSFAGLFATRDQKEGMMAFVEKRKPQFRGE